MPAIIETYKKNPFNKLPPSVVMPGWRYRSMPSQSYQQHKEKDESKPFWKFCAPDGREILTIERIN
ncbi:MAG: hypothetical protein D6719_01400 [Candidatus Dadabacteria bacterium]|nr:MAG: hypothetical protein D6719_01400 [Candidatus Dadabacteria bacterium]